MRYGLSLGHLERAKPGVKVLHPGPMNRGLEIAPDVADAADSLVLDQVSSGVCVRMALLYLYITRKEEA
jgi:aspartate carbamoyltransferase catalytic subunit